MAKRVFIEWVVRILLLLISLAISLLIAEFILQKCIRKDIRRKIEPEPYEFITDSHGFRISSKDEAYSTDAGGCFRIICLGDSFTFGHGVSNEGSYPFLLERYLNKHSGKNVQIINAGVCGATIDDELKMYADNCVNFDHQQVILLYQPGDMQDLYRREEKPGIIDKASRSFGKNAQKTKTMQLFMYEREKWERARVDKIMKGTKDENYAARDYVYGKYIGYLGELNAKVRSRNARLAVIFYYPEERIIKFCSDNGICVIDITEEYDKQKEMENLYLVYHHNKRGNEFLAQQIGSKLIEGGFLDGKGE